MRTDLDNKLATLSPSYFALVMATGIVSVGADLLGVAVLPTALFVFNVAAYVLLWLLNGLRLVRHPRAFLSDLTSHQRAFGFLTMVAGTGIVGTQSILLGHDYAIATVLLAIAAVLWVLLTYTIFTALTSTRMAGQAAFTPSTRTSGTLSHSSDSPRGPAASVRTATDAPSTSSSNCWLSPRRISYGRARSARPSVIFSICPWPK